MLLCDVHFIAVACKQGARQSLAMISSEADVQWVSFDSSGIMCYLVILQRGAALINTTSATQYVLASHQYISMLETK